MKQTAEEKVLEALTQYSQGQAGGVTASDLSVLLKLSRNVVSHYLNRLGEQGLATKKPGKPVLWTCPEHRRPQRGEIFSRFIGWDGSFREAIELCRAAVQYPPDGLPLILCGPSGVGKSALAELVCQYARATGAVGPQAPMVTLNCADYANNPQLLSSTLFGYKRGAFTGADHDQEGLVQQADGGYLFLDEVHRLSFENQEKLFILLDQGRYRPLGEGTRWLHAKVRLICATTEDVDLVLLQTFRRRIPVRIDLQAYGARPLDERLRLIAHLCSREAKSTGRSLLLDPAAANCLLGLEPAGNVGALHNVIRLSCARAFQRHPGAGPLTVTLADLQIGQIPCRDLPVAYVDTPLDLAEAGKPPGDAPAAGSSGRPGAIRFLCGLGAQERWQLQELARRFAQLEIDRETSPFSRFVGHSLLEACRQYGITDKAAAQGLCAWYLLCRGIPAQEPHPAHRFLYAFARRQPHAAYVAGQMTQRLLELLPGDCPRQDLFKAAACFVLGGLLREDYPLRGLIAAHGDSTATSIAAVANQLCRTFVFEAIDMPMDTSVDAVADKVRQYIDKTGMSQGLVLLVDMGSLGRLYSSLKHYLQGELLIIDNVTTAIALDVGTKIASRTPFEEIARYAEASYRVRSQYYEGLSPDQNIIFTCISGLGISEKLREIVMEYVEGDRLKVIAMEYHALKGIIKSGQREKLANTRLVVTTTDLPESSGTPVLIFSQLWEAQGEALLWECLADCMSPEGFSQMKKELFRFFSVEGVSSRLSFLNPKVVMDEVEDVLSQYEKRLGLRLESFRRLNLFLHISVMIERLLVGDKSLEQGPDPTLDASAELEEFCGLSQDVFGAISAKYHISISGWELALLRELLLG